PVGIVALNFQGDAFTSIPIASLSTPVPVSTLPLAPTVSSTSPTGFILGVPVASVSVTSVPVTNPPNPPAGFGIGRPVTTTTLPTISQPATVSVSPVPTTSVTGAVGAVVFPEVVSGGNWSTEIALGNSSDAAQVARIDFFNPAGTEIAS